MKTITKPYLNNRECSVQEAFYNILPKLKLRKIFRVVYFISTNTPEERTQVLLLKKNLANYQTVFQILSRNQILIPIFAMQNFEHIKHLKINMTCEY